MFYYVIVVADIIHAINDDGDDDLVIRSQPRLSSLLAVQTSVV